MKKIILTILLILATNLAFSQNWEMKTGAASEALQFGSKDFFSSNDFVGATSDIIIMLRYKDNKQQSPYLVSYDHNLVMLHTLDLPIDKKQKYYVCGFNNGIIDLLETCEEQDNLVTNHISLNAASLELKNREQLGTYKRDAHSQFLFVKSQNDSVFATIFLSPSGNEASCKVTLYNSYAEELWNTQYYTGLLNDIIVTDSGEVAMIGYTTSPKSKITHIQFTLLDGDKESVFDLNKDLEDPFRLQLLGYRNGKFYVSGLIKSSLWKDDTRYDNAMGFITLTYDGPSESVSAYERHTATIKEFCAIENYPVKSISEDDIHMLGMKVVSSVVDEDGVIFMLQETYDLYYSLSFDRTNYFGFFLVKLDVDGNVSWIKAIRHNSAGVGNKLKRCSKYKIIPSGDKYMLFYLEKPKNLTKNENKFYDLVTPGRNGAKQLMATTINRQGEINNQFFTIPKKSLPLGAPHTLPDGKLLILFTQSNSSFTALFNQ